MSEAMLHHHVLDLSYFALKSHQAEETCKIERDMKYCSWPCLDSQRNQLEVVARVKLCAEAARPIGRRSFPRRLANFLVFAPTENVSTHQSGAGAFVLGDESCSPHRCSVISPAVFLPPPASRLKSGVGKGGCTATDHFKTFNSTGS